MSGPETGPVTIGMMRAAGERLHIYCRGCGHEREPRLDRPPFDRWRDSLTVVEIRERKLIRCNSCGEKDRIWVQGQNNGASADNRRAWGWTEEEIEAAGPTMGVR